MVASHSLPLVAVTSFVFAFGCTGSNNTSGGGGSAAQGGSSSTDSATGGSNDNGGSNGTGGNATGGSGGTSINNELPVDLGHAGHFAVLAKSGVSTVPSSMIVGDLGVSPAAASFITGFTLKADATNVFATSKQVIGKVYAANYAVPTPSNLTAAIGDMELAFTDASGRAPDVTELGSGNIGGMTLSPGVYKWGTGLLVPADVTLAGGSNDVWIFQIAKDLVVSSAAKVTLSGGARAKNVFWQISGLVDVGTTAHLAGTLLGKTAITLRTGASIEGRLLAQTAVNIDANAVTEPSP